MKVAELIEKLQQCPAGSEVCVSDFYGWMKHVNAAPVGDVIVGRHTDGEVIIYLDAKLRRRLADNVEFAP